MYAMGQSVLRLRVVMRRLQVDEARTRRMERTNVCCYHMRRRSVDDVVKATSPTMTAAWRAAAASCPTTLPARTTPPPYRATLPSRVSVNFYLIDIHAGFYVFYLLCDYKIHHSFNKPLDRRWVVVPSILLDHWLCPMRHQRRVLCRLPVVASTDGETGHVDVSTAACCRGGDQFLP